MLLFLLAMGCCLRREDPDSADHDEVYLPPDLPGPWEAGADQRSWTGPEGDVLPGWVWFPTVEAGSSAAVYGDLGQGEATTDATPDCAEARPVAVLSHASGGVPEQSWFLAERLATHGWVVAAPAHAGNTHDDNDLTALSASILRRPLELAAAFDGLLTESGSAGEPLAGCVDPDAGYAAIGDDLGGATALMAGGASLVGAALDVGCQDGDSVECQVLEDGLGGDVGASLSLADSRVQAVIAIAPSRLTLDAGGLGDVSVGVVVLGATDDASTSWDGVISPTFDALTATPRALGGIVGAGHLSVTALCPYYPTWPECADDGSWLPVEDAWAALEVTVVPALELMRGDEDARAYLPPERAQVTWEWVE